MRSWPHCFSLEKHSIISEEIIKGRENRGDFGRQEREREGTKTQIMDFRTDRENWLLWSPRWRRLCKTMQIPPALCSVSSAARRQQQTKHTIA